LKRISISITFVFLLYFQAFSAFAIPMDDFDLKKEFEFIYQDLIEQKGFNSYEFSDWQAGFLNRELVGIVRKIKARNLYLGLGPVFNHRLDSGIMGQVGYEYPVARKLTIKGELNSGRGLANLVDDLWASEAYLGANYIF